MARCCTCGYRWKTGTNGGHCCSDYMERTIPEIDQKGVSQCCICGCTWETGKNGSHCCSDYMKKVR